jgi:hypothetical protein
MFKNSGSFEKFGRMVYRKLKRRERRAPLAGPVGGRTRAGSTRKAR